MITNHIGELLGSLLKKDSKMNRQRCGILLVDNHTKFIEVIGQEARMSIKLGNWGVGYANIHDVWKIFLRGIKANQF